MKTVYRKLCIAQKVALFVLVSWTGFSWWAGWPIQGFGPWLALGAGVALVFLVAGRAFNSRGRFEAGRTLPLGIGRHRRLVPERSPASEVCTMNRAVSDS